MTEITLSITPTDVVEMVALQRVLKEFESRMHASVRLHSSGYILQSHSLGAISNNNQSSN